MMASAGPSSTTTKRPAEPTASDMAPRKRVRTAEEEMLCKFMVQLGDFVDERVRESMGRFMEELMQEKAELEREKLKLKQEKEEMRQLREKLVASMTSI
jgi:cell division septation protein DedD